MQRTKVEPAALAAPTFAEATRRPSLWSVAAANPDLVVLLATILADVRLFQGTGAPASFTLAELVIWLYCFPVLMSRLWAGRLHFDQRAARFLCAFAAYVAWVLFAAAFAIWARGSTSVLQLAKNVVPSLVLAAFLLVRLRDIRSCLLLADLYVVWSLVSCFLAFAQFTSGGPYVRPLTPGAEDKLTLDGETIENLAVGLTGHPNALAIEVLPATIIALFKLSMDMRDGRPIRLKDAAVLSVLLAGLMLSQAKAAIVWTAIAFVVSNWVLPRHKRPILLVVLVLAVDAAITWYSLHQAAMDPASSLSTVETRYLLWQTALSGFEADHYVALLGDGMGYVAHWSIAEADWYFPSAHNGWLDQVVFFGIPGLIAYGWIWTSFFRGMDQARPGPSRATAVLMRATQASILAYAGLYMFEPTAADMAYLSQLTLLMGIGIATAVLPAQASQRQRSGAGTPRNSAGRPIMVPRS